jgi:hypothetical protein
MVIANALQWKLLEVDPQPLSVIGSRLVDSHPQKTNQ